jgi:poly(A) polymerase Pap1
MEQEKVFANGFIFKRRDNAPEFVIGELSVRVSEAVEFLQRYDKNGWVNLNINISKSGKKYVELNTFEPKPQEQQQPQQEKQQDANRVEVADDLPF